MKPRAGSPLASPLASSHPRCNLRSGAGIGGLAPMTLFAPSLFSFSPSAALVPGSHRAPAPVRGGAR